jgi:hypothetical protein
MGIGKYGLGILGIKSFKRKQSMNSIQNSCCFGKRSKNGKRLKVIMTNHDL